MNVRLEYVAAGALIVATLIGLYVWQHRRTEAKAQQQAAQRRMGPIEHPVCDQYRNTIVEKSAELSTVSNDPLKEGNLRGEIARATALRDECERQENRRDAVGQ